MTMFGIVTAISKFIIKCPKMTGNQGQQIRNKYADWQMIRDVKRRKTLKEFGAERMRINSLRKNDILPVELREIADQEVAALPRDSNYIRVRHRCAITSRPRGVVFKWRLSRIVWRHLADYNKLAGVQRAMW
ncbi:28S ribosomal protein S14, mitochondrial isoform X1 [Zootermopsis nevadensis]|uniref:28S ribosomal protein S14, mitochondrial n=1 Tax=Zootermopsis nevadensis TaxID=136037 RepID=A0A067R2A8_ZOONE|nr:28S ribosomal protein S14, mitochondrial isoform X1 [Zootermopsis nevadensis]KDR17160.1 28S ribosomal protein S14, mitochondrial [Zootermopsis nevadensis]